jgi:hypothetical protein
MRLLLRLKFKFISAFSPKDGLEGDQGNQYLHYNKCIIILLFALILCNLHNNVFPSLCFFPVPIPYSHNYSASDHECSAAVQSMHTLLGC